MNTRIQKDIQCLCKGPAADVIVCLSEEYGKVLKQPFLAQHSVQDNPAM
jgi:hypothetical protein